MQYTFIEVVLLWQKYMQPKKEVARMDKAQAQKDGKMPQAPGSFSDDKWNPVIYG